MNRGVGTVGAHAPADFREGTFVHARTMYDFHNSTDTLKFSEQKNGLLIAHFSVQNFKVSVEL